VAASATQMDTRVTLLEVNDTLWTGAVGSELGRFLEAFLRDRGVHVRTRIRAERLEGGDSVQAVLLPDGTRLHADLVVIGVGARPDTELAERAGLPVGDGVLVDRQLRATESVWAAGDVANVEHPLFGRVRTEHWAEALDQGLLAGRNLAGAGDAYDRVPYFYSDQFDLSLSFLGHAKEWDKLVIRGSRDTADPRFVAWYLRQGTPTAALMVNHHDIEDPVRELIRRGKPVDAEELQRIL
jgi:3-phenylpropionate/trans-cinnamate dioxygenase ferredoxin reductase subunit